jgi:hypothetical protein
MSDSIAALDQTELATDAAFANMLERVSFQPGIMLGSEALTAEQSYHLRRLTRHQRWLIGPGTVFGLRVDVITPADDATDVRLTVAPGYAIDGLGREVLVTEAYAISLRDWLAAENASPWHAVPARDGAVAGQRAILAAGGGRVVRCGPRSGGAGAHRRQLPAGSHRRRETDRRCARAAAGLVDARPRDPGPGGRAWHRHCARAGDAYW